MGLLVDGKWHDKWYDTASSGGKFIRSESQFRHFISKDGSTGFKAEAGRYHLYASYACPWVHRVLIYRKLKGLEDIISVSFVHWLMADKGWSFQKDDEAIVGDQLYDFKFAHEIYTKSKPNYSGRVTVPILWDKHTEQIVSNESAEIIRMLNTEFDDIGASEGDYYPENLRSKIDEINDLIYNDVNNGVYKAGFSTTQTAYEDAVNALFQRLDWLENKLAHNRFLLGDEPCEADWRLFPTLYRFDSIYVGHFKCSKKRIMDYEHLWRYARDLYQWPGIKETVNMEHARRHYYESHDMINPTRITPLAPDIDWEEPL